MYSSGLPLKIIVAISPTAVSMTSGFKENSGKAVAMSLDLMSESGHCIKYIVLLQRGAALL